MGLLISHGCFSDTYGTFNEWREALARVAGWPPLSSFEGMGGTRLWDSSDPLAILLSHKDDEGVITYAECCLLVPALERLLPALQQEKWVAACTAKFVIGLRKAIASKEDVVFE
jgi:hypothetical protein